MVECDLTTPALDRWIKQAGTTGSRKEKENCSQEENEGSDSADYLDNRQKKNTSKKTGQDAPVNS